MSLMSQHDVIKWHSLSQDGRGRLVQAARQVFASRDWVSAAYLFGSAAHGQPARDIDIGLVADSVPSEWAPELALAADLETASGIRDVELDVRVLNGGDPVFLNNVLRDGFLLYEADRERRIMFEAEAMSRWLDFRPVWERMRRAASKAPRSHE